MFCNYMTTYAGMCGCLATHGDKCKRHVGKIEKIRPEKKPRIRGNSSYQVDMGYGDSLKGSNAQWNTGRPVGRTAPQIRGDAWER